MNPFTCTHENSADTNRRWLAKNSGQEACIRALQKLRNLTPDHPYLREEVDGIFRQLESEREFEDRSGRFSVSKEMWRPRNRQRLTIGVLMFIFMQMAGSNAINYYSPAILASIGLTGSNTALFATGIYGLVRFIAIIIAMIFVVDRFGRTRTLMIGGGIMVSPITSAWMQTNETDQADIQAFAMWFIGAYIKIASPSAATDTAKHIDGGGYAAIVMIYIYAIGWCFSWAGVPWIYASEIFPLRIRSPCVAICVAIHWIMNFVIARSTPYMINNIKYGTYFLFATFMTIGIPWVYFCVPETKGLTLEDMDHLFGSGIAEGGEVDLGAEKDGASSHEVEDARRTSMTV